MKQKKPTVKADLPTATNVPLSQSAAMNSCMEKISPEDIVKSWNELEGYAKVAGRPTISVQWANGITSKGDYQVGVTASTTHNGFVLRFTVKSTYT